MLALHSARGKTKHVQSQLLEILSTQAQCLHTQHICTLCLRQDTMPHHTATPKRHTGAPHNLKPMHAKHMGIRLIGAARTNGRPGY